MASYTTYGANAVLNGTAIPATLYLKAHIGNPGADAANNAAAHTTRQSFTRTTSTVGANSNAADIEFTALAANETWSHWSAWDAASGGNPWFVGTVKQSGVASPLAVTAGGTARVVAGDLDFTAAIWA